MKTPEDTTDAGTEEKIRKLAIEFLKTHCSFQGFDGYTIDMKAARALDELVKEVQAAERESTKPKEVTIVWLGLRQKPETHQIWSISEPRHLEYALGTAKTVAEMYDVPLQVWQERSFVNHVFAYEDQLLALIYTELERAKKRQEEEDLNKQ